MAGEVYARGAWRRSENKRGDPRAAPLVSAEARPPRLNALATACPASLSTFEGNCPLTILTYKSGAIDTILG